MADRYKDTTLGIDIMTGGDGNDRISGQAGNDIVDGEAGSDQLLKP
jgi:Ca2+-binding RTX toxin-like protein